MLWATDAPSGGGDPLGWVNYGVMGLLIVGLVTGLFWVKPSVDNIKAERDRALAERDKAIAQRDQMAETFQREWLPMLTRFLASSEAILPLMQRMVTRDRPGGDQ